MGTEILRPQDCLNQRLRFNPASFSNPNPNPNRSCRKQASRSEHKRRSPPPFSSSPPKSEPAVSKKPTVADDRKLGKNLVLGQVKILKRGENIDLKNHKNQNLKKSFSADLAYLKKKSENLKKTSSGDLKSFSERLGPNPEQVTARFADLKPLNGRSDVYAGSTFDMSPSPRALPLPKFSMRREAVSVSAVDDSATQDLRRLLRIG